ncbi:SLAP domain-containing protein [Companilactobacillus sp. HBUAS59699]|uniref:SLAP domain-containing protein n=1 Tax=Companilactobacillus sp. HBUAS59699 TaxID=3109358 RepID=UPI002FF1066A
MTFKKLAYRFGVSLFSAMILMPLASQTVKADPTTTTDSTNTTTTTNTTAAAQQPTVTVSNTTTNNNNNSVPTSVIATNTTPTTTTNNSTTTAAADPTTSNTANTTTVANTSGTNNTTANTGTAATNTATSSNTTTSTAGTSIADTTNSITSTPTLTGTTSNTTPNTTTNTAGTTGTNTTGTTNTATGSTATNTTGTTTTTPITYPTTLAELQSLPDSAVISFADPIMENVIKFSLQLPDSAQITAGELRHFNGNSFTASEANYYAAQSSTHSISDTDVPAVETLNGMQYLQLLPATAPVQFQVKLASDPNADEDLSPLYGLKFSSLELIGNFSNPNAKEIDVSQLNNLDVSDASSITLIGDYGVSYGSGLTNQQLQTISPWLNNFSLDRHYTNYMEIDLGNTNITDFTPLKPLTTGPAIDLVVDTPAHIDNTPVYAVDNNPITFTAPPVLGLDGEDLAGGYHFSNSVPQQYLSEEDLTNLGNDHYVLEHPTPNASVLAYGYLGYGYSSNPDNFLNKNYGNVSFQYFILNGQPIIWQSHPTVTVNYLDSNNQPIMENGKALQTVLSGTNIGDPYDLTKTSQINGYQLTSPTTSLKGNFTQDPQVINLIYNAIENNNSSTSSSSSSDNYHNNGPYVQVYDQNGQAVADKHINLNNKIITASIVIHGKTYYRINKSDHWVLSPDFYSHMNGKKAVWTFASDAKLVDNEGKRLTTTLAPDSQWKVINTVTIDGQKYYELAPTEFILASDTVVFTPQKDKVHLAADTMLYNSRGQALNADLSSNSNWYSDGSAVIDHQKMYRVANDEWVKAADAYTYQPIKQIYHANKTTELYNSKGQLLPQELKAGTDWKTDQLVVINGQTYYRVATDEFVKA